MIVQHYQMDNNTEEKDPTICNFFEKTGCCSKFDLCNKSHKDMPIDRTLIFHHLYPDPDLFIDSLPPGSLEISDQEKQRLLDAFFLDVGYMLGSFGQLDDLMIMGNRMDHMSGNVIAIYLEADSAMAAYIALNNVYYAGRKVDISFSSVSRMSSCVCRNQSTCPHGNTCCFVHPLEPSSHIFNLIIEKSMKGFPPGFRKPRSAKSIDSPMDALYGNQKSLYGPKSTTPSYLSSYR